MYYEFYMRRALQLAENGAGFVSPNPMVGAVIVTPDGKIIGEGWHRCYGGPHAEVNAVNSVRPEDEYLIPESTIFVTLEPCSHYGKTPPCSKLLTERGFKRAVIGLADPFREVSGRGIRMLRKAGIEVVENVLEEECRWLNRRFVTAHTLHRPYILLKWAQSADGFIAAIDESGNGLPVKLSNPVSAVEMHKERALYDAILAGTNTIITDNPSLTTRLWPGHSPRPATFYSAKIPSDARILSRDPIFLNPDILLHENMSLLYSEYGITSVMIEGGSTTLQHFLNQNLYDEIRVETSSERLLCGIPAPSLPSSINLVSQNKIRSNLISIYHPCQF